MVDGEMTEQVQTQQAQTHYTSPLQTFSSSIVQITDPSDVIKQVELNLRQAKTDMTTGEYLYDPENMLLNEYGIRACISFIQGLINQNTVMSNLNENDVQILMRASIYSVTQQLMLNRPRWGIKHSEDRTRITQIIFPALYICLKRPYEEGERSFWKGAIGEHVVQTQNTGQVGHSSLWQKLNPFGKR